jgi:hypothetical protein
MNNKNNVSTFRSIRLWLQSFLSDLFTPVRSSPEEEKWLRHFNGDTFDKHWRYSRANHGLERSMWIL